MTETIPAIESNPSISLPDPGSFMERYGGGSSVERRSSTTEHANSLLGRMGERAAQRRQEEQPQEERSNFVSSAYRRINLAVKKDLAISLLNAGTTLVMATQYQNENAAKLGLAITLVGTTKLAIDMGRRIRQRRLDRRTAAEMAESGE